MQAYYLAINIGAVIIPFLFSFHRDLQFHKRWRAFFPALGITALAFILWDMLYTHLGVWGFNAQFLTGINIFNLPLEEILFFFCIPYACVFTYHCLHKLVLYRYQHVSTGIFSFLLAFTLLVTGLVFFNQIYTSVTFILLSITIGIAWFTIRQKLFSFYCSYAILLIPFFLVNGALTGMFTREPVVWYDNSLNLGIRLGTIPVEDVFYGMLLILIMIIIMEKTEQLKKIQKTAR